MIQLIFVRMGTFELFDKAIDNLVKLELSKDGRKYVTTFFGAKALKINTKVFIKKNCKKLIEAYGVCFLTSFTDLAIYVKTLLKFLFSILKPMNND